MSSLIRDPVVVLTDVGLVGDVALLSRDELTRRMQDLERLMRGCEAAMVAVLDEVDKRGVFSIDGHRSVRGWAGATVRWSDVEIRDRCRTVTLVRDVPDIAVELMAGRIGIAQVRELARVRANPRCGDQIVPAVAELIDKAENIPFNDFRQSSRQWEALNDADGSHRDHEYSHEGRRVSTSTMDHTFHLFAQFGAIQGAAIAEVLSRFEQAEFDTDWDELKARVGDDASVSMLERTAQQRRADAMHAIFMAAASTPLEAQAPEPVVNIIVDQTTFEDHMVANATGQPPPPPDPADTARRCETDTGVLIDPADVIVAAVIGHVRRVVMNSAGVVIEMGRKHRLFTGSARTAALLQGRRCTWPGCGRNQRIHLDHTIDWQHDGTTDPWNAGPACAPHNYVKNHGYRVERDGLGRWHTYRPDGTEITAT